jgi:hypothetical protein
MAKRRRGLTGLKPKASRGRSLERGGLGAGGNENLAKVVKSGTITLPPGAIPSPSGGKSSALDFSQALMQGNPIAVEAATRAMNSDLDHAVNYKPEDEASVADKFVASTYDWCKYFRYTGREEKLVLPQLMAYRHAMRHANKFVLDNEFTEYATTISNSCTPAQLLARIPLATLPYETTWIEFDLHVKVRTMRRYHGLNEMPDGAVSPRMGMLLERVDDMMSTITLVTENDGITHPNFTGYLFSTDERHLRHNQMFHGLTPFDAAYRMDILNKMPVFKDVMGDPDSADVMKHVAHGSLWGYGNTEGVLTSPQDIVRHIRVPDFLMRHGQLAFSRFYDFIEVVERTRQKSMGELSTLISREVAEFTGMMRWLVIVLAMLNEVPTRANFVKPTHSMRAGLTRRVPAFDFHRLTLRLPKTKAVPYLERKLRNVERRHKAHKVQQHWRTYLHVEHCLPDEHAWEYDNEHGYALCGKCMAFRRRIHEHVRGDPSLGWVHKEYLIKPAKQE